MSVDLDATRLKKLAKQLLLLESAVNKRAGTGVSAAFRVCEQLRQPLAKTLGIAGFHALLSRALALSIGEVPWLRGLQINADGSLADLGELVVKFDEEKIASGEQVLVARLLELLFTFIGPALTLQLLQDAWPKANFDNLDFGKGQQP